MITVLLPPVLVLTWSGLRGATSDRGRLGRGDRRRRLPRRRGDLFYTLLLGLRRVHVALMALVLAVSRRRDGVKAALDPLLRLAVIGVHRRGDRADRPGCPYLLRAAHDPVSRHRQRPALPAGRRRAS